MKDDNRVSQEKLISSECSLESEINTARINALELKLETLSIITESLWNMAQGKSDTALSDLQGEMGAVISARALRDQNVVVCERCKSAEKASKSVCRQCGSSLVSGGDISPFDY